MNRSKFAVLVTLLILALVAVAPGIAQDDPIEVKVWIAFTDYRLDWANERAAEFEALYPEYDIVIEGYGSYNELFDATLLAFEQGTSPAVIHFFEAATQEARDAVNANGEPLLLNVSVALDGRTEVNGVPVILDDIVSAPSQYYTVNSEFTSVPWNTSSTIMFSNMSYLEATGIESVPETWQELEVACEAIMALEDAPEYCVTWPNHSWWVEQTMGQLGFNIANNDNGRDGRATEVTLNSPEMVDYITWWANMEDQGYYLYTGTQRDWGGTYNAFIAQQVAFLQYSSSDTIPVTNDGQEAGFDVVASRHPYNGDTDYVGNIIGGATLWLVNGLSPEVQDGALMFMNFFSNAENSASWHQTTGYIPISNSAIALLEEEGWYEEFPNATVASDQLALSGENGGNPGPLVGNFVAIRDVVTAAIEDILVNDVDIQTRLDQANEEANTLLEEYNLLYSDE